MSWFSFWHRWLLLVSILFCLVGLAIACLPDSPFLDLWNTKVEDRFHPGGTTPEIMHLRNFLLAPLGATIAGFYILQSFIVFGPFKRREPWAWWAVALATFGWFLIDSARSLQHEAGFNVMIINSPTLILVALPLGATWRNFMIKDSKGSMINP